MLSKRRYVEHKGAKKEEKEKKKENLSQETVVQSRKALVKVRAIGKI
jgi:hypothetical protein